MLRIQSTQKKKTRTLRRIRLLALLAAISFALVLLEKQIRPVMLTMARYECRQLCLTAMNQAVADAAAMYPERFRQLYKISTDREGRITSVVADPTAMSAIKSDLTTRITHRLSVLGANLASIPLGSLLGWQMFAGRGPTLHFRIIQESYVNSDIVSRLNSAGANQSELLVFITFQVTMRVIVSGYSTDVEVQDKICIAQALIAGKTPQFFYADFVV